MERIKQGRTDHHDVFLYSADKSWTDGASYSTEDRRHLMALLFSKGQDRVVDASERARSTRRVSPKWT